ncbi:hypothetical protein B7463_g2876, partial [Scytalidium lignicola]
MGFNTITTIQEGAVLKATINDGDINVLNWKMMSDLNELLDQIKDDSTIKVLVFYSSIKEFFIAHLDLMPRSESTLPEMHPDYPTLGYFFGLMYKLSVLPIATIAVMNGRCRGGGNDLAMECDMRFGTKDNTILMAPEVVVGLFSAGGGGRRMVEVMGTGKAYEFLYSGTDVDAVTAEKCGWINQAFDNEEDMTKHVDKLSNRIGKFNLSALNATKACIRSIGRPLEGFEVDFKAFVELIKRPEVGQRIGEALTVVKGGTYCEEELNLGESLMPQFFSKSSS